MSQRPLRILEVITPSKIGGAETQVAGLIHALTALGDEVSVFCPQGRPFVDYLRARDIEPISWKTHGKLDFYTAVRLAAVIKARNIDLVHTHLTSATFLGSLAARLAGRPCLATVHGLNSAFWYRSAPGLLAVSDAVKRHLVAQGIPDRRMRVLYNGIALARYSVMPVGAAKRAAGLDPRIPVAGIFGRLSPEKGQAVAVDAWSEVASRFPQSLLILAGAGKCEAELREQVAQRGLTARVRIAGFVDDPRTLMAACDVVLLPSFKEGLSMAALEAMALGRPVIASAVDGLPEVVVAGETGLLVLPGDRQCLAQAITTLFNDPARAADLGTAGRRRVAAQFDADQQLARLRDIFAETIAGCQR